jgi:multidrug/hemolysin transport system permease protein
MRRGGIVMVQYFELVKRNMRIYLRDRGAVFFSLLSMMIVLILMLFFLGDMSVEGLTDFLSALPGRNAGEDADNALMFVTLWTCAGIVSINAVTVTLAVYSSMIKDRTDGRFSSICTAPVSRITISSAYVTSAWLCSCIICVITLVLSEIYCIVKGGMYFSFLSHVKLFGMIGVNSFTYAALMYLAAVLVKTQGAWSGIGTVVGTLVGFLGGIYIPIGSLAENIGNILKCTPVIYGAKMFRSIMTEEICSEIFDRTPEILQAEYLDAMGVRIDFFGVSVSDIACVMILLVSGVAFMAIGAVATKYMAKNN